MNALWLGLSPDMAKPDSADPVERMSTRVTVIGVGGAATTTFDAEQMREWVGPQYPGCGQIVGLPKFHFAGMLKERPELEQYFDTLSPPRLFQQRRSSDLSAIQP